MMKQHCLPVFEQHVERVSIDTFWHVSFRIWWVRFQRNACIFCNYGVHNLFPTSSIFILFDLQPIVLSWSGPVSSSYRWINI